MLFIGNLLRATQTGPFCGFCKLRCAVTQAYCSSGRKRQQGHNGHQPVLEANSIPKRFKAASAASELECLQSSAVRLLRAAHCKPATACPTPALSEAAPAPVTEASDTQPGSTLHLAQASQVVLQVESTRSAHLHQRCARGAAPHFGVKGGSIPFPTTVQKPVTQLRGGWPARQQQVPAQGRQAIQHIWHYDACRSVLIAALAVVMSTADFIATTGIAAGDLRRHQPKAGFMPLYC